jgi:hypothetical protein
MTTIPFLPQVRRMNVLALAALAAAAAAQAQDAELANSASGEPRRFAGRPSIAMGDR